MLHYTSDGMKFCQRMAFVNLCFTVLIILLCTDQVNCKWCTRTTSEKHVYTITEATECQQSYRSSCGWFSSKMCTFYETVTCYKEHNQTMVQYKLVEECCPGYVLDPTTNVTCIKKSVNESKVEEVTLDNNIAPVVTLSPLDKGSNLTQKVVHKTKAREKNYTVQYYKSNDELLFGLSHGAYAGIICAFLFISCVLTLIIVHVVKRKRKDAAVAKESVGMENELVEKWIPTPPQA